MATDGKVTYWDATAGSPTYNAQELRQLDAVGLMPGPVSAPFSGRSGRRVNNSGLAVTLDPTGNGSVTVSAGVGTIYDAASASEGTWRITVPTAKTVALAARPGSGTSRIDLVVARIYNTGGATPVKELKIETVTGVASATPAAPALPPLSLLLSTAGPITSASGAAISKTDTTAVTVAAGGILPVATTLEMDNLKTANIAYRGMVVDNAQTGALHRYNGTNWTRLQDRTIGGKAVLAAPAIGFGAPTITTLTFPAGLFTSPPILTFGVTSARISIQIGGALTVDSASVAAYNSTAESSGPFTLHWTATQFS